jgi:hypothetical protein
VSVHALVSTFLAIRWVVMTAVVVALGVTSRMIPSRLLSGLMNDSVGVSVNSTLDPIAGAIELMRELVLTGCGGYEREKIEGGVDSLSASIELPIDPSGLSQFSAVLCPA